MKLLNHILASVALIGCVSCVETNGLIGGNLIPIDSQYEIFSAEMPLDKVEMRMADSLSGFSQSRIVLGAVRDDLYGLSKRSCALTIVPLGDTLNLGSIQSVKSFHLHAAFDTTATSQAGQERILQNVYAYALDDTMDWTGLTDANDLAGKITHGATSIIKGTPLINGASDLDLDFTADFANSFVNYINGKILSDSVTFDAFLKKFPGIWLETDEPSGNGGRLNSFELQMNFNTSQYYLEDNYGAIVINTILDGETEAKDTTIYFYVGAQKFTEISSLFSDYSTGTFPQYAFNVTQHSTRALAGNAADKVYVEGGAGLKPVIAAKTLIDLSRKAISDTIAANNLDASLLSKAIINKATIVLPYDMPADYTDIDNYFPPRLSPTCRIKTDTTSSFMGLTDASSENEDQGNINRSICSYTPDITYHLQQLLNLKDDNENLIKGNYDIWMLIMSLEETTTTSSGNSDLSEYYQYLAYQSYYNSMYGGYGGYGYGSYGYGNNYYSNYYSYMMAAMYAGGSTSTSTDYKLDKDFYYRTTLCGPASTTEVPKLRITFSVPKK
ncbi:MAG: hypothetical protein IKS71_05460 [Bacteroidales bacterium]|nr:hypothetical protein [Bacteroidales bacterium]